MNRYKFIVIIGISFLLCSCSGVKIKSAQDLYKYLNEPANGCVKERKQDQFDFKLKYLPPEFFVLNEIQYNEESGISNSNVDSLFSLYKDSRTFLLTISTNTKTGGDIMFEQIASEPEYRGRVEKMNFYLKENIYLKTDQNKYLPVLVNLENVYGLSKSRNITIVFAPINGSDDLMDSEIYDIVFEDVVFNTGINHFKFHKKDIDKQFELEFLKNIYNDKK